MSQGKPEPPYAKLLMECVGGPCDGDTPMVDVRYIRNGSSYIVAAVTPEGSELVTYIVRGKQLIWEQLDKKK